MPTDSRQPKRTPKPPTDLAAERARRAKAQSEKEDNRLELQRTKEGLAKKSLRNVMTILAEDYRWKGVIAYDEFSEAIVSKTPPPTCDIDRPQRHVAGEWTEADSTRTAAWIAKIYGADVSIRTVEEAIVAVSRKMLVHPVRDYLQSVKWDGVERLPELLCKYFGVKPSRYATAVGMKWMISAVARAMRPGCKVDTMLILEGVQGAKKSTAIAALVPTPAWFSDTGITLGDKDSYQNLRGKWIYEMGELDSLKRTRSIEKIKAYLSSPSDNYRPSFGRRRADFPRQTVFFGSTNELDGYFLDNENRRFWPVRCSATIDVEAIRRDRDQLWAEALMRFELGEAWWIDDPTLESEVKAEQSARVQQDPWKEIVETWGKQPYKYDEEEGLYGPRKVKRHLDRQDGFTVTDILLGALEKRAGDITSADEMRIGRVACMLGWQKRRPRVDGHRLWKYYPPESTQLYDMDEREAIEEESIP
jgi:putative DNA primase/helicase